MLITSHYRDARQAWPVPGYRGAVSMAGIHAHRCAPASSNAKPRRSCVDVRPCAGWLLVPSDLASALVLPSSGCYINHLGRLTKNYFVDGGECGNGARCLKATSCLGC